MSAHVLVGTGKIKARIPSNVSSQHTDGFTQHAGWRVLVLYLLNMPLHGLISRYVMPNYAIHMGGLADKDWELAPFLAQVVQASCGRQVFEMLAANLLTRSLNPNDVLRAIPSLPAVLGPAKVWPMRSPFVLGCDLGGVG